MDQACRLVDFGCRLEDVLLAEKGTLRKCFEKISSALNDGVLPQLYSNILELGSFLCPSKSLPK
eukprot:1737785-Karenia_brevis.AAC.1